MKTPRQGFTLIELLVVIAIIAILSGIALFLLTRTRNDASDSKTVHQLNSMKAQAELYTGLGTTISFVSCPAGGTPGSSLFNSSNNGLGDLLRGLSTTNVCAATTGRPSEGAQWVIAVKLNTGIWCVDSTGASRSKNKLGNLYDILLWAGPPSDAAIFAGSYLCN